MSQRRSLFLALPQLVAGGKCSLAPGKSDFFAESCARNHDDPFMCCGFDCRDHGEGCSNFCCYGKDESSETTEDSLGATKVSEDSLGATKVSKFVTGTAMGDCVSQGLVAVSEADCKEACVAIGKDYSTGQWPHAPGCFTEVNSRWEGNCHWNSNMEATWFKPESRPICSSSETEPRDMTQALGETLADISMPLIAAAGALILICFCVCCMMCKRSGKGQPAATLAQGGAKSVSSLGSSSSSSSAYHQKPSSPKPGSFGLAQAASASMPLAVAVPAVPSPPPAEAVAVAVPEMPIPPATEPESGSPVCRHCGAQVLDLEGAFCGSCGQPLR